MIRITLNGEPHTTPATSVAALLAELALDPAKVAVERNLAVVPRSELVSAPLAEGDT
ncbi:MAG: sulfur carrier protein ThiS, partial [Sphingomonadales bacterium]